MQKPTSVPKKIPVLDIPELGAFQYLYGNEPEMELNGTRVTLLFDANNLFYELSARYNSNEPIPVLDFLHAQRQLKAKMFALKLRGQR